MTKTTETESEILDTTDEIVQAFTAVNHTIDQLNSAESAHHLALYALRKATDGKIFKCSGRIFQVRERKNKETGLPYPFLVNLKSMPSEYLAAATDRKVQAALAEIKAGTRTAPEVVVEKVSSDEQLAPTGTDGVDVE